MNADEVPRSPREIAEGLWLYHAGPASVPELDDLDALAARFIQLKRHLGHRYTVTAEIIRQVLGFLRGHRILRASEITHEALDAWALSRAHVTARTWMGELRGVSVFFDHLQTIGKIPQNPCRLLPHRKPLAFRPFIFPLDDLRRIFAVVGQRGSDRDRGLLYHVTYAAALRCCEVAHLRMRDVDFKEGVLRIWKTKFQKDRVIPIHASVLERLRHHCDVVRADAPPDAPVFVGYRGRRHEPKTLSWVFRSDVNRLGLYRPIQDVDGVRFGSPRMHSLRHSFAVHRLLRWYRDGADVQSKLPLLSTFLGHSAVAHSQVYLTIVGLLLREAHDRFSARWEKEFPLSP